MANQRIPNDAYRSQSDPYRSTPAGDDIRDPGRLDDELQPDPELTEGPAGSGRIAALAVAIAVILGAVFYGLNNSSIDHAGTSSTAQNTAQPQNTTPPQSTAQNQPSSQPAPPGGHANTGQGVTTGAAPAHPQNPPSSGPTGQDNNRSGNPPANNAPANK